MKQMKVISIVWGMIMFGILALFTIFAVIYTNKNKEYKKIENTIEEATKKYGEIDFIYKEVDNEGSAEVVIQDLIGEGLIKDKDLKVKDDKCSGYTVVTKKKLVYEYKGYIKCENYTTKGYSDETESNN